MFSVKICFASSTVFPTKFGIATSLGLLAFEIPIVNPNVITNNKINPTIDDKTLWFFINCANLLGFLLFFALVDFVLLSSSNPIVEILWVGKSW